MVLQQYAGGLAGRLRGAIPEKVPSAWAPGAVGRFFRQCGAQAPHLLTLSLAGSVAGAVSWGIPTAEAFRGFSSLTDAPAARR